ncbi:uncharacterized protein PV06_06136 [Exophiala oligosperma]|uniref:Xylanolytic transcriptional activator regulatory domain-containing protein n=1 Tax=Exophiala oligosperma TaxID=215243 RepID=A0A0D2E492_9EURO|nr:uncharacterized protein PV06_06136 [Exophiala oligosperma]KIW42604.1 hypothetical protein PV06_06136 [Exophiala oligosperma]
MNHVLDQSESIGPSIQPTRYEDDLHMNGGGSLSTQTGDRDGESSSSALQPQLPDTTQNRQDWNMSGDLNEVPYLLEYDFSFDYDVSNLFAMDLDWNALVEPSFAPPSEFTSVSGDNQNQDVSHAPPTSRAVLGHEAFKRSPWVWQADSHDSADVEEAPHLSKAQEKLLLPRFLLDRNSVTSMAIPPTMGDSARDAILLLVQRNSGPTTTVQSFPSVQTLNFLLMNFLFREKDEGCPFIHMPSLVPDKCRPELLTAMIAAGAVTVGIDQIWRLGLAFQERTRMALFHAMDTDSSLPRNLDVVRASLLWIETGLWCGSGRKMEVADSAANNMLRRAGVLYAGFYETETAPLTSDNGDVLKTKWLKWVKLESFKRLALRALMSDVQSAMASMRSTTFSSTDINFALPASRDLWDASSARKWKTLVLAKKDSLETTPTLTLMDIIQDPWKLRTCGDNYDRVLSITAALYCLWPQVASFLDSRALQRSLTTADKPPASSSPMWLEAQRQDLYQRLSSLRELARSIDSLTADVHMACELFSMSLFVSPIDTQKFVGRCGAEESQVVAPSLQYWAESDERRYAMWHAGQVLRAARNMIPAHIQGFRAISVYQACLTLALPHLLSGSGRQPLVRSGEMMMERDMTGGNQQTTASALPCSTDVMTTGKLVILNDEEGIQSKSYLSSRGGHQTPALLVSGGRVQPISNVEMIANTMAGIFRDNHRRGSSSTTNNSTLPPLLERLIALLTELSKAT